MEEQKKSFREELIEKIGNRSKDPEHKIYKLLELALVEESFDEVLKPGIHALSPHIVSSFPIQEGSCTILENGNGVALCFKRRLFLLTCVGKKRIDALNNNKKKIEGTLQEIENVLGKVAIVDKLREELTKYQTAVSNVFDFIEE